jgi:hypothetical protein
LLSGKNLEAGYESQVTGLFLVFAACNLQLRAERAQGLAIYYIWEPCSPIKFSDKENFK